MNSPIKWYSGDDKCFIEEKLSSMEKSLEIVNNSFRRMLQKFEIDNMPNELITLILTLGCDYQIVSKLRKERPHNIYHKLESYYRSWYKENDGFAEWANIYFNRTNRHRRIEYCDCYDEYDNEYADALCDVCFPIHISWDKTKVYSEEEIKEYHKRKQIYVDYIADRNEIMKENQEMKEQFDFDPTSIFCSESSIPIINKHSYSLFTDDIVGEKVNNKHNKQNELNKLKSNKRNKRNKQNKHNKQNKQNKRNKHIKRHSRHKKYPQQMLVN
jgi:hypothetical protein